ncbi:hypothetical protein KR044_005747, partial [Drosophila immigrans]
ESVVFKYTNAVCESFNKTIIIIEKCRVRVVNRQKTTFNFNCTLMQPVRTVSVVLRVFKRANGYKPWLYTINVNVCQFLEKPYNPIALLVYNQFKPFTNFENMKCPLIGIKTIEGAYPRHELMRLPLPTGEYLLFFAWKFNGLTVADTNISFAFIEDLTAQ